MQAGRKSAVKPLIATLAEQHDPHPSLSAQVASNQRYDPEMGAAHCVSAEDQLAELGC